ncbi:hypothetical protein ONZ45_g9614 [Pleurotus djamor]|nr:hypothetical protein ONZ45_g9614 [Pleurotus djamor]
MASSARHRQPQPPHSIRSVNTSASPPKPRQPQASLAKRLLFPSLPSNELPPLLNSPSVPPELTSELYDFIALALRAFVNPWWTKITRYDKDFLPEITRILTVVIQSLEARILAVDLSPLVFRDLPTVVSQHYDDYRNARSKVASSYATGGALTAAQLFHQAQPHMAITPEGNIEPEYLRQVVDHILKSCLPKEDYDAEAERFIVREIILKVVLGDIIPKVTQPWFIHKTILDLLDPSTSSSPMKDSLNSSASSQDTPTSPAFSFHNIAVFFLSAIQSISGFALVLINTYKQARTTIRLINESSHTPKSTSPSPLVAPSVAEKPVMESNPPLPPSPISASSSTSSSFAPRVSSPTTSQSPHTAPVYTNLITPNYAQGPIYMTSKIFNSHDRLAFSIITTSTMVMTTYFAFFLDRLLPYTLDTLLSPQLVVNIVRAGKRTLFPNGYPAPAPPDPTLEEQAAMKERLTSWKPTGALAHILPLFLGPTPSNTLSEALDPLSSAACNTHLILVILDRIISALFPELSVHPEDGPHDTLHR